MLRRFLPVASFALLLCCAGSATHAKSGGRLVSLNNAAETSVDLSVIRFIQEEAEDASGVCRRKSGLAGVREDWIHVTRTEAQAGRLQHRRPAPRVQLRRCRESGECQAGGGDPPR